MGTDEESGRGASVETEKWRWRRYGAGSARSVEASCAIHADHGPLLALRPCLRKDLTALLRASGSVRRRVCAGVVQADAPRHGADLAVPWPARSERASAVARPCSRRGSQLDRGAGHRCSEGEDPRIRTVDLPTGYDCLGIGGVVPRLRQARWGERGAHSPRATKGLGSEPADRTGEGSADAGGDPNGFQQLAVRREEGLAGWPDRSDRKSTRLNSS